MFSFVPYKGNHLQTGLLVCHCAGDDEAKRRGVQKSILERAAPPTFDVAVEMLERTKYVAV